MKCLEIWKLWKFGFNGEILVLFEFRFLLKVKEYSEENVVTCLKCVLNGVGCNALQSNTLQ